MRRLLIGATTLAAALVLAAPLSAQFFVQGSATLPQGDYKDYAKTGWMANAGIRAWQSANGNIALWAEGFYGSNSHEDIEGDKTNLLGGYGSVTFNLTSGASATPYLIGSVGYMRHQYKSDMFPDEEGSDGGVAFGGGAGLGIGKNFFVEGRYITASIGDGTTAFIMLGGGVVF